MRISELDLETFRSEGVDNELREPRKFWKELIAALRYLGNSAWPALKAGEEWGDWKEKEVVEYFAAIVDALRSIYFPVMPKADKSSYWELYWKASKLMKSKPPEDPAEWDAKRKEMIGEGESIEVTEGEIEEGIRPAFGSPGWKRLLAGLIASYIPDHKKYVEPFIGGGAVFFKKKPSESEVINDKDPEIAFAYRYIQKTKDFDSIKKMKMTADRPYFEKLRDSKPSNEQDRFHRHLYLIHFSFGQAKQNYAPSKEGVTMDQRVAHLDKVRERLQGVTVNNTDFRELIKKHDGKDTFFYFDPPYPKQQGKLKTDLTDEDIFEALKGIKGKWILSLPKFAETKSLFTAFNVKTVSVRRTFDMKNAHVDKEFLISNFPMQKSNRWLAESFDTDEITEGYFDGMVREKADEIKRIGTVVLVPDYVAWSGSLLHSEGRQPNDIEWIIRNDEVDPGEAIKIERISNKLFPGIPPHIVPAKAGPNWRYMGVYDLALIPKDEFSFMEVDKNGFKKLLYEQLPRAAGAEIRQQAMKSLADNKIQPHRFFMMMKPVRVTIPGKRQEPQTLMDNLDDESFEIGWYASKKFDGMAVQIHKTGDKVSVFSEDGEVITDKIPSIVDAIKKLKPENIIVAAELEYWENKEHKPRERVAGEIHKKASDDTNIIANIFELLYFDDQDLHETGYAEHRKIMDRIDWPQSIDGIPDVSKKLNLVPDILIHSKADLMRSYETLRDKPASEGFVIKRADAPYSLDTNSRNKWFKLHENVLLHGTVIDRVETKTPGIFNYIYGINSGDYKIKPKDTAEVQGKNFLNVGTSFSTNEKLNRGDILMIEAETINFIKDERDDTVSVTAWAPRYFGKSDWNTPDSIDTIVKRAKSEGVLMKKSITPEGETLYEAKDPYMESPDEDKKWDYVVQHHWRGKTTHADLRFGQKDYLVGWTLMDLIAGEVKDPVLTLKDAKEMDKKDIFKIDWGTGNFKQREVKGGDIRPTNIRTAPKKPEPLEWMEFEGVSAAGEVGATKQYPGVFDIIDKGEVEYGAQRPWFHEYFLRGGKLKGRLVFRLISRETESISESYDPPDTLDEQKVLPPGVPEEAERTPFYWVAMQPIDQTPYVLSKGAIVKDWLPPKGESALPKFIRDQVPVNMQYWKTSGKAALEMRKELVDADILKLESIQEAEQRFVLQRRWWKGPVQIRWGPSTEQWDLRMKLNGKYWNLVLKDNPLENTQIAGYVQSVKDSENAMLKGKDGREQIKPGTDLNPTKDTPAWIDLLDSGGIIVLEDEKDRKKIQFNGKKLDQIYYFKRENADSPFWLMSVSGLPKLKKESFSENFVFPLEINHNGKKYVIRETRSNKLIMN